MHHKMGTSVTSTEVDVEDRHELGLAKDAPTKGNIPTDRVHNGGFGYVATVTYFLNKTTDVECLAY